MPNKDYILFLDLETTGSEVEKDEIIEVGLVLLDAHTLEEVDTFSAVSRPSENGYNRIVNNSWALENLGPNGLLNDIDRGENILSLDVAAAAWLKVKVPGNDHIPYGGSGVSHFDRPFIKKFMPKLSNRLTYWSYDVGCIRRTFELAGATGWPGQEGKNHRALVDARFHAEEFRFAVGIFASAQVIRYAASGEIL